MHLSPLAQTAVVHKHQRHNSQAHFLYLLCALCVHVTCLWVHLPAMANNIQNEIMPADDSNSANGTEHVTTNPLFALTHPHGAQEDSGSPGLEKVSFFLHQVSACQLLLISSNV